MSENKGKTAKRTPIKPGQAAKAVIFLVVTALLFQFFTLVYDRPVTPIVTDYKSKPENTIDVVSIGSSNVYRYFVPTEGWDKYGISGFAYALAGAEGANTIWSVKDVLKTQKPKLLVLEVRGFLSSRNKEGLSAATYRILKNYRNPIDRFRIVRHYCRINDIPFSTDQIPYYLTLLLNHENYWALFRPANWKKAIAGTRLIREPGKGPFLGYSPKDNIKPLKVGRYNPDYVTEIGEEGEASLREILDYCRDIDQDIMLAASPFAYEKESMGELNAIRSIAEEYGVNYLNTNEHISEMGIDWKTDFYNDHHTNIKGAVKYSNYLFDYIHENYELEDHRGDKKYSYIEKENQAYQVRKAELLQEMADVISGAAAPDAAGGGLEEESETE